MPLNYSKHKDRSPEDTVFEAQRILNDIGLFPVVSWYEAECGGAVSNRVNLYPTSIGTNGKGTDKLYAAASGYAELLERMQNGILFKKSTYLSDDDVIEKFGFADFPDEKLMSISEMLSQGSVFFDVFFNYTGIKDRDFQELFIKNFYKNQLTNDGKIRVIPFANVFNNSILWLPFSIVRFLCSSNGMAAGNTIEEAMVQGLSEVFERWVHPKIITAEVIPPEIPREYLKNFAVYDLIEKFESGGRYTITILDCSLGKGLPVAASVITDKENGSFLMKLGSHPSFEVAVERTLTETAQGTEKREKMAEKCTLGTIEQVKAVHNINNIMRVGIGCYSNDLILKRPDWEFSEWRYSEEAGNKELLKNMIEILRREGLTFLVRDVSFLGFPACYIVVPGVTDVFAHQIGVDFKYRNTVSEMYADIEKFPYLSAENEARLLTLLQFLEGAINKNALSNIFSRSFKSKRMTSPRVGAFLALKLGRYELSRHCFDTMYRKEKDEAEKRYLKAMIAYVTYLEGGLSNDEAHKILRRLFAEDIAERVISETQDLAKVMERNFPHMKCFDCGHCELSGTECLYQVEKGFHDKVLNAMKKGNVSQESLLNFLNELSA